jgi:hypothetical protein
MTLQPLNRSVPPPQRSRTRTADRMTGADWRRPFGTGRPVTDRIQREPVPVLGETPHRPPCTVHR